jgi:hypothetical protein
MTSRSRGYINYAELNEDYLKELLAKRRQLLQCFPSFEDLGETLRKKYKEIEKAFLLYRIQFKEKINSLQFIEDTITNLNILNKTLEEQFRTLTFKYIKFNQKKKSFYFVNKDEYSTYLWINKELDLISQNINIINF